MLLFWHLAIASNETQRLTLSRSDNALEADISHEPPRSFFHVSLRAPMISDPNTFFIFLRMISDPNVSIYEYMTLKFQCGPTLGPADQANGQIYDILSASFRLRFCY